MAVKGFECSGIWICGSLDLEGFHSAGVAVRWDLVYASSAAQDLAWSPACRLHSYLTHGSGLCE